MNGALPKLEQTSFLDLFKFTCLQESGAGVKRLNSSGGLRIDPCGREAARASHLAMQAKDSVKLILGTFGRYGLISSASESLQSFLASRLQVNLRSRGSTAYSLTWKERVTPAGRRIYALRASAPLKSGSGFGGYQTPMTRDGNGQSGKGNRIRRGKNGRLHVANLCDQLVDLGRPDLVRSGEFRCWLMGYPEAWDVAGATAMQSFRKSPRNSSKQPSKP